MGGFDHPTPTRQVQIKVYQGTKQIKLKPEKGNRPTPKLEIGS